ncbi:hypothetical protein [Isoptericola cucumis]|uniref:Sulfotransferase family protein n=1 Tax=Isoptericola cucumis TaxID=1776856 RepID=A0ABQ2BCP3_9MICO|nr:hypothetical protein [Isoptericola cucumis]GGI12064.1 hypothetical protein GCM10007368_39310 [Isoptericola cucumis]
MPRRVFLHVGAPKSGTTYLQSRLRANRRGLRAYGVRYPLGWFADPRLHYWAALEVTDSDHGVDPRHVDGSWRRLLRRVRRARGDVVVSHEMLAKAAGDQAARALADLAATGAEVHVVLTARDLARELTSGWQETLKFGSRTTFRRYLDNAQAGRSGFMQGFDPTRVLAVWGADLPAERIHVVTAPPPGHDADLLWSRFLAALGVGEAELPREASQANASVGIPEAQVLRRLNRRLGEDARRGGALSPLIEGIVVSGALASRRSPRITLGPADHPWVAERSDAWIEWLRERGVRVHGDLDDLRPGEPDPDWVDPDVLMPQKVAGAALDTVEVLLGEVSARRVRPTERVRRAWARLRS